MPLDLDETQNLPPDSPAGTGASTGTDLPEPPVTIEAPLAARAMETLEIPPVQVEPSEPVERPPITLQVTRPPAFLPAEPVDPERLLVTGSPDPAAVFDADGRLLALNDAAVKAGAPSPSSPAAGASPHEQLLPFWSDPAAREKLLVGALAGSDARNHEVRVPLEDGAQERIYWVSARRSTVDGDVRIVAAARDVSLQTGRPGGPERKAARASHLYRDPVTGFLTRETFQLLLEQATEEAGRAGTSLTLVFFDLDDFKVLNDTHGMAAGDEYLRRLGDALRANARSDTTLARLGGDEFGVLFPATSSAEAGLEADNIVRMLTEFAPVFEGRTLQLSASAGVAVFPDHAATATDLMLAADMAMHQAKKRGRARFLIHDPAAGERERIGTLRRQADRIRTALAESRFVPVYQPIAEVTTGRIVAVETLARLRQDDGSLATPESFLDAAERFGFVTTIDRLIITQAFDALSAGRRRLSPDLELSINLSGIDFEDDSLVADISRLARAKGVSPSRITFEITETAALRDLARVQDFTRALTSEGFRFALDDFGVGFSSFGYLRDLPMSVLKFDQSYVRNLPSKMENRVFVRGLAEICRGFGVKTVAEGVESASILSIVKELGVDRAQGYFIGLPSPELPAGPHVEPRGG